MLLKSVSKFSNLGTLFNSVLFQLRLKTALTNEAEALQNFIID